MHEQTNPYLTLFPTGQVDRKTHQENSPLLLSRQGCPQRKRTRPMRELAHGSKSWQTNGCRPKWVFYVLHQSISSTQCQILSQVLAPTSWPTLFTKQFASCYISRNRSKKWMIWLKMNTFCQRESAPSKTTTLYCKIMVSWLAATGCLRNNKTVPKNAKRLLRTSCFQLPVNYYDQLLDVAWTNGHARTVFTEGLSTESQLIFVFLATLTGEGWVCTSQWVFEAGYSRCLFDPSKYISKHHKYSSWIQAIGRVLVHTPSNPTLHCSGQQRKANNTNDSS